MSLSHMARNSNRFSTAHCILPFMLSKEPLRLCTISVQILGISWAGPLVTFWNIFKHWAFQIYQIVILLTNCHISYLLCFLWVKSYYWAFEQLCHDWRWHKILVVTMYVAFNGLISLELSTSHANSTLHLCNMFVSICMPFYV